MNKVIILSLLILPFCFCSCDGDVINLVPVGDTESVFYQNEVQMDMAMFGIYQKNGFFYHFRGGQWNHVSPVYLLPSDDLTSPESLDCENFTGFSGNTVQTKTYYQFAYQLLARANTLLQKIEENGAIAYQTKPEQKEWNKGEALFFRAYMHIQLWNVFGTAPKVMERMLNLDKVYLPNTHGTELLDVAIDDLAEAAQLLPHSWPDRMKGRLTKNSAFALRSKALVFRGAVNMSQSDFIAAIEDINQIQDVALTARYGDNFELATENNCESLFEYQANDSQSGTNPYLNNDEFAVVGELTHYTGIYNKLPNWIGNLYYVATEQIKNEYEAGDPRRDYNINMTASVVDGNVLKYIHEGNAALVDNWAADAGVSINNPRILRYADVLLLKAEALVRSGGSLSEAIGLINQVRERARNSTDNGLPSTVPADRDVSETGRDTVLEWIFLERRLELAFEEGHRWWDLRRRHMTGEIDLKTFDFGSLNKAFQFRDHNVYFPLPSSEVVDNIYLNQNTGY